MPHWDVFISHASEDKDAVARPLSQALRRAGLKGWLDELELCVGDRLREKIEHGLSKSRFGVVILSPHFFSKKWPKEELGGLTALEDGTAKVILPVWHDVDKQIVLQHMPMLADRVAARTIDGIPAVARSIAEVVFREPSSRCSGHDTSLTRRLLDNVEAGPVPEDLSAFLLSHRKILALAVGNFRPEEHYYGQMVYLERPRLGREIVDLAVAYNKPTSGGGSCHLFIFCPSVGPLFNGGAAVEPLKETLSRFDRILKWTMSHPRKASKILFSHDGGFRSDGYGFLGVVVAGRRDELSEESRSCIRRIEGDYSDTRDRFIHSRLNVRTYDWLAEVSAYASS
jgi:hypothetical protein